MLEVNTVVMVLTGAMGREINIEYRGKAANIINAVAGHNPTLYVVKMQGGGPEIALYETEFIRVSD